MIKNDDVRENIFELKNTAIREEHSINRSFWRVSYTDAQNRDIPKFVIETQNRWRKFELAKTFYPN